MILLRTADAARRLGLSVSYLEKQRHFGTGPDYVKLGRAVAYREADLAAWIETNVHRNTSEAILSNLGLTNPGRAESSNRPTRVSQIARAA